MTNLPRAIWSIVLFGGAAVLFALSSSAPSAFAQPTGASTNALPATFDLDKDRELDVSLSGLWHFHTGDDPAWSSPALDDSRWPLIQTDRTWDSQGYPSYTGTAWYRARIIVPSGTGRLALYLPNTQDSFQVFADGQLLATQGGLPPHGYATVQHALTVLLPPSAQQGASLCLAIRVWVAPDSTGGILRSIRGTIRIGDRATIEHLSVLYDWAKAFDSVSNIVLAILETLAGFTALALFAFRITEREYLWFGIALLLSSVEREVVLYSRFHAMDSVVARNWDLGLSFAVILVQILFYSRLLRAARNWLYWSAIIFTLVAFANEVIYETHSLPSVFSSDLVAVLLLLPSSVWVLALVFRRAWQGVPDARLLMAPVLVQQLVLRGSDLTYYFYNHGWIKSIPVLLYDPINWPFSMSLYDVPDTLFLLATLAILVHRFTRTRLHEESYEREREAARVVQQVLIPEESPDVPGFEISSVYRPFGEVGGDFFQVLPVQTGAYAGSLLAVIGDVSGKGLPAAMAVSLLVGTFRTVVDYTQSPAEILSAMNKRMSGRSNGGFTTCLVLRVDSDQTVTVASAGHISPYIDNQEIPTDSGLPLGLSPTSTYAEVTWNVGAGQVITLTTDGVVEARSASGELFGFDRTLRISHLPATEIAQTAVKFGQDDDITVLQLSCLAPTE